MRDAEKALKKLTSIQCEALAASIFLAGSWGLSDLHEDHPDIVDDLPESVADCVSGILTPLGCRMREIALARAATATQGDPA